MSARMIVTPIGKKAARLMWLTRSYRAYKHVPLTTYVARTLGRCCVINRKIEQWIMHDYV